ncbi:penicillin-binding transpeptidase domain-containing protein [Alloiococcus sp. CFN-8]|uniref:penicillin-binding transpeptidase domain-containing protein n=1 Tax=Alloiococcus sp. CFN-8 TaxID=3416081 RepID=UPI003CE97F5E
MNRNNHRIILLAVVGVLFLMVLSGCSKDEKPSKTLEAYKKAWENKDYKDMYSMLSKESKEYISEEDFVTRYTNVYSGIEAENIKINLPDLEEVDKTKEEETGVDFSINMDTLAGNIELEGYNLPVAKEKEENKWRVIWDESLIFPEMDAGDKVLVESIKSERGEIFDRNGEPLAVNGEVARIEIKYNDFIINKEANVKALSEVLDISEEKINKLIENPSNPDWAIPVVNVVAEDRELILKATTIKGVQNTKITGRIYPGGEPLGSLIGYIEPITAEELENHQGEGYSSTDNIGKLGLEQVFEDRLKGENGWKIYISKAEADNITVAEKEAVPGEDITITVDKKLQTAIYEQLKGDIGSATAIHPQTGEVLALVSSPSFNSNYRTTYTPDAVGKVWEETDYDAFNNRFNDAKAPGSTFKLLTGAVALDTGAVSPEETLVTESGLTWQKDGNWGGYKVTRVKDPGAPVDLRDAFVYSDNIYFAKAALEMGADTFEKEIKERFGVGEELPFAYPMDKSQLSNQGIERDVLLADSAYGQGEVLMTPLHVALAYSAVVNEGNIMKPQLEASNPEVWKEGAISSESLPLLKEYLTSVIEDPNGSGYDARISGVSLSGKTGTAELKKSLEDTQGEENGWFVAMDNEDPSIVLVMMVENVKTRGGSHYVVPKAKAVLQGYLVN